MFFLFSINIPSIGQSFYENIVLHEYDNGLKLIYKNIPSDIIAISLVIKGGSVQEGDYQASGLAHLVEHMIFESRKDLDEQFRELGAVVNASTSHDYTLYHIEVNKKYWVRAFQLLWEALFKPKFSEDKLKQEKKVIMNEMKMRDDNPASFATKLLFKKSYQYHPYGNPIIGEKLLLDSLTLKEVKYYHSRIYQPNNSYLAIVGNIGNEIEDKIAQIVSEIKPHPLAFEYQIPVFRYYPFEYQKPYPGKLVYLMLSFPGVSIFDQDLVKLDLLAHLLGEGKNSLFYREFVETGLAYGVGCYNYTPLQKGLFIIHMIMDKDKYQEVVKKLKLLISNHKNLHLSSQELSAIKKEFLLRHLKTLESPLGLAINLSLNQALTGRYDFDRYYLEKVKEIRLNDIKEIIDKYFNWERVTIVKLLPQKEIYQGKGEAIAYKLEIERIKLSNGLRLILARKPLLPFVAITVVFNGGLRSESLTNNGITRLAVVSLLSKERIKRFREIGAQISSFSGNNSFGFQIEVAKDNLLQAIQLLAKLLIWPKVDPKSFRVEKKKMLANILDLEIDPFYQALKFLRWNMFQKYSYKYMPEGNRDSLSNIRLIDINDYFKRLLKPDNCVLTIAGDFSFEDTLAEIKRVFKFWKAGAKLTFEKIDEKINKSILLKKKISTKEAILMKGYLIPGLSSSETVVPDILSKLWSGSGTEIYRQIRKQLAAAYSLGSFIIKGPELGIFVIYVATTKEKIEIVNKKVDELLSNFDNHLNKEVIENTKLIIKTEFQKSLLANSAIAFRLSLDELLGLGYDYHQKYLKEIDTVSILDLKNFIQQYFLEAHSITVWVGDIEQE